MGQDKSPIIALQCYITGLLVIPQLSHVLCDIFSISLYTKELGHLLVFNVFFQLMKI